MKTDGEIRDDVISELAFDPQLIDPDAIGVAVTDGAVSLAGHVSSYAEKIAAARAAERVYAVKAVANELKVKLPGSPRDDSDIATAIAHVLEWNVQVPERTVQALVQGGWVTLEVRWSTTPAPRSRADGGPGPGSDRRDGHHHPQAVGQPGGGRGRDRGCL